jgi:hypothetical protein
MTEALEPTIRALARAETLAEQEFLAMGQGLESAIGILDRLIGRFVQYIGEFTGDALGRMGQDLTGGGDQIRALVDARVADVAAFGELGAIAISADRALEALRPITGEVEALAINARIVAGDMGIASQDFIAFAGDIRRAARYAGDCLTEARDALGRLRDDLKSAGAESETFARQHGEAMRAIPTRLSANLQGLEERRQVAADASTAAHRQSEDVRRQVAQQIVALQLGDITRQRVEHVRAAVAFLTAPTRAAGALFAAQIDDTAEQLTHMGDQIEGGLRHLAIVAKAMGQLGEQVHGAADDGGFIVALEADIARTAALFRELSASDPANDQRIAALLEAAGAVASRLTRLQWVQEDIRLMGLNASLKCGRLGSIGRPLAIIARELRTCGGRFGASAEQVRRELDSLGTIAATLSDASRTDRHVAFARATDELLVSLRRLRAVGDELGRTLAGLREDAQEVGRLVEAALARFSVRHTLVATLRDLSVSFAAWPNLTPCPAETFDRIAACYTMAREREVHARFAPLPRQQTDATEDILF